HGCVPVHYHRARASGRGIGVALDPTAGRPYFAPETSAKVVSAESCRELDHERSDDERSVIRRPLLVAGRHAAPLLEPTGAPLDHVAAPIPRRVEPQWPPGPPRPRLPLIAPLELDVRGGATGGLAGTACRWSLGPAVDGQGARAAA